MTLAITTNVVTFAVVIANYIYNIRKQSSKLLIKMENTRKVEKIWLPYGAVPKLQLQFGVSRETVRRALNYMSPHSVLHDKIRQEALDLYGGQKIYCPSAITN